MYNAAEKLVTYAGTFWNKTYDDDLFNDVISARCITERQTEEDLSALRKAINRKTTPIYKRTLLQPLVFNKSTGCIQNISHDIVTIPVLTDALLNPHVILFEGLDYIIDQGKITFKQNPFNTSTQQEHLLNEAGDVIESCLTLWAHNTLTETHLLADMWGAPVNLIARSSEAYRNILCTVYGALALGTTAAHINEIFGHLCDCPVCIKDEIVKVVANDGHGWFVATDTQVYRGRYRTLVTVGQHINAGEQLFDGVKIMLAKNNVTCKITPETRRVVALAPDQIMTTILPNYGFDITNS